MSEPGLPRESLWNRSRAVSLAVLALYGILQAAGTRPNELNGFALGILPALVIWFPDFFAEYTGILFSSGPAITRGTPAGCLVVIAWVVLMIPLVWMAVVRSGLIG